MALGLARHGIAYVKNTVGMGQSKETKWHEARNETDPEEVTLEYGTNFPWSWEGSAIVGVERAILFFDTTGYSGDMALRLFNTKGGSPCYQGGSHYMRIMDGSGADYDFDEAIYGWMLGRMGSEYLIAEKLISDIDCLDWGEVKIPASYINGSGYTILIVTTDDDQEDDYCGSPVGSWYIPANTELAVWTDKSYIWVEGTKLAYIDGSRQKRTKEGTLTGITGKLAGLSGIKPNDIHFYYIDSSGNGRKIAGTKEGATGKTSGQIGVNANYPTKLAYIDGYGDEEHILGDLA